MKTWRPSISSPYLFKLISNPITKPQVQSFSQGKTSDRNEDYFASNENSFVLADGVTDKSGRKYEGQTGGEIVSRLIVNEALESALNGAVLIAYLNHKIYDLYENLHIVGDITDPRYRFAATCIAVRIVGNQVTITHVGDSGFRINGHEVYWGDGQAYDECAEARAKYIAETGDVAGSREHIMPLLLKQYDYQNNPDQPRGFGIIDGTGTPDKFIKTFVYPLSEIKTIEFFTDGYRLIPEGTELAEWENAYQQVEREDPDKWRTYKATKSRDDRTIAIIKF